MQHQYEEYKSKEDKFRIFNTTSFQVLTVAPCKNPRLRRPKGSYPEVLYKKLSSKISQNSKEIIYTKDSFLVNFQAADL